MDLYNMLLAEKLSGGGGSSWTLLHEEDVEVSTTSTSPITVTSPDVDGAYTSDLLCVIVTDKAGPRNGYLYRNICFIANHYAANNEESIFAKISCLTISKNTSGAYSTENGVGASLAGIYVQNLEKGNNAQSAIINIVSKYNSSNSRTIDGTFTVQIYKLSMPDGSSPFA